MERLSQEILDGIIQHLFEVPPKANPMPWDPQPVLNIHSYAGVSRSWQSPVERHTLANLRVLSSDLPKFQQIFSSPRRRALLRKLHYEIDLPTYSANRIYCVERRREIQANQHAFCTGMAVLFRELAAWTGTNPSRHGIELALLASSPMDLSRRPSDLDVGLGAARWKHHDIYLTLDGVDLGLPSLPWVNSLVIPNASRDLHPSAMARVIASLSGLERLSMQLNAPQPKHARIQKGYRLALATALESPSLKNLRSLDIYIEESSIYNHNFTFPDPDPSYPAGDAVNIAIRKLAENKLRTLHLTGWWLLSPALFSGSAPFPYLETMKIEASLLTYDGRWLYTGNPNLAPEIVAAGGGGGDDGNDNDRNSSDSNSSFNSEYQDSLDDDRMDLLNGVMPDCQWKVRPDPELFDALAVAAAAAVPRMPALQSMLVSFGLSMFHDYGIVFEWLGPQSRAEWFQSLQTDEELSVKRWNVTLMPEARWQAPDEVTKLWKEDWARKALLLLRHLITTWVDIIRESGNNRNIDIVPLTINVISHGIEEQVKKKRKEKKHPTTR